MRQGDALGLGGFRHLVADGIGDDAGVVALAKQDKDGYFFITGRKKNVIVLKNGKNIYPEELETLVGKLPYVDECMVFGYPKDDDLVISVKSTILTRIPQL